MAISEDIQFAIDYEVSDIANIQAANNLGTGFYKMFFGLGKILFPMNWSIPETDRKYQQWYENTYGTENQSDINQTYRSDYYIGNGFGGSSGNNWGIPLGRSCSK